MRLHDLPTLARLAVVPVTTVKRRLAAAKVKPDATLVSVAGLEESSKPLFLDTRVPELIGIVRPERSVLAADTEAAQ